MVAKAVLDELRSLDAASISGSYAAVGSPLTHRARLICITNNTQGDMLFSDDGSTDKLFVAAGNFKLFDITSNINPNYDDAFCLPIGTQFYVKQSTAPVSGDVYIEILH